MQTLLRVVRTKLIVLGLLAACTVILANNYFLCDDAFRFRIAAIEMNRTEEIPVKEIINHKSAHSATLTNAHRSLAATVQTNKDDYAPGECVEVTGSGWFPGEVVSLNFLSDCGCTNETIYPTAYDNSEIFNNDFLITENHLGARFTLTAIGDISGLTALATFTDAAQKVNPRAGPITGGTSVTIGGSGFSSGSYTVNFDGISSTSIPNRVNTGSLDNITTPAHPETTVNVEVIGPDAGSSSTITNGFTYVCRTPSNIIFDESMGAIPGTTGSSESIESHESANRFDNDGYTMSGTADVRNSSASSGSDYEWATGNSNVFITSTPGTYFQIEGINTSGQQNLKLSFGIFKSATAADGSDLIVEVSSDGTTFSPLSFAALPAGAGTADWYYRLASGLIPATSNLRIKFRQNGNTTQIRIDDIRLIASPLITNQPADITVCEGSGASFSVIATGSGLTYQWQVNTGGGFADITNGGVYSNATSATLNITGASGGMNGYSYRCVVTGSCTPDIDSDAATLSVNAVPPPDDPADVTACDSYTLPSLTVGNYFTGSGGTGTALTAGDDITSNQTIYVYAETGTTPNCRAENSFLVAIKTSSLAPTSASTDEDNICPGTEVTLSVNGGSLGTGATWNWYTESCDEASAGSGSSINVSPSVTTTYYVRAEGDCNITECASITVNVRTPTEISSISTTKYEWTYGCESATVSVVASGQGDLSYQWYHKYMGNTKMVGTDDDEYIVPELAGAGIHEYWVVVTGGCGSEESTHEFITINPQVANAVNEGEVYYTGPSVAFTANSNSSIATFTLSAFIKNSDPDVDCGDIATARVSFFYRAAGSGSWNNVPNGQNLPVNYADPLHPSLGGTAAVIAQLNIGNGTCELYDILVTISGNYTGDDALALDQLSIMKPQPGGTISGGAKLANTNSTGFVKGVYKTDLGFYVNYSIKGNKVQNPKGKVNLTIKSYYDRFGILTNTIHRYKITSNAIASLVVGSPSPEKATFTSKANIAEILNAETGELAPMEGNCTLVMNPVDVSGCDNNNLDKVGIVVYRNSGGIWYSNNFNMATGTTDPTPIHSGCIWVSTSGLSSCLPAVSANNSITRSAQAEVAPLAADKFNVKAYPNPTGHQFTLVLEGATGEKVAVVVHDVLGRVFYKQEVSDTYSPIRIGEGLKTGIYFVQVTQGDKQKTIKLVKQ